MQTNNTGRCTNWKTSRHLYGINDTKPCRQVSQEEEKKLEECLCPACRQYKLNGLKISGMEGFCNRATHNLWILLEEARLIEEHLYSGNYKEWYKEHLDNTIYRPLIAQIVENLESK